MGSKRRLNKKTSWQPTSLPVRNPLQPRPFGKGIQARRAELPKTNVLQTRPFGTPKQASTPKQEMPDLQAKLKQAESFGYNAANIPTLASSTPIQAKLTIGEPNDKYEQEADQVASQVVNQINSPQSQQSVQGKTVQRETLPPQEEEETPVSAKLESGTLQREALPPEEEEAETPVSAKLESGTLQREALPPEEEEEETPVSAKLELGTLQRETLPPEEEEEETPVSAKLESGTLQREALPPEEEEEETPVSAKLESGALQREALPPEEEEEETPVSAKLESDTIQRQGIPPEEEEKKKISPKLMRKSQSGTGSTNSSVNLEESIQQKRGQGQSLSEDIREPMEQAFGADFSGVKVHTDSQSDQLNRSIQARAFTTGQDVFFKQGEYNPGSKNGQELLAHELTHVVQQTGTVQRDDDPAKKDQKKSKSTIEELRDALSGWGADSAKILQLLGKASASEKKQILADSRLMGQLQSKLSRREMLQALNALEAPLKQKLNAAMKGWGCDAQVIKDLTASAKDAEKKAVLADTALVARLSSELSRADMLTVLGNLNAPVKDKLNAAMDGWGVDAEAIKALTKGASDAQKQAVLNDAALGSRLSSELSRADMLTVLGNLNAPVKDKLNAVMDGWGTDEQAIRELMVNATGAERNKALSDTVLVSRLASELSLSEMMSILADAGVPFKTRFELALNPWSAELSQLQPLVENATDAERQTVWSDAALMSQANTALGEQDYLTLVTTLGMFQPGTTAEDGKSHTSAGDADTYIQTHIATYVAEAVKNGRQIAGLVAVVDNADWDRAGIAHYGASTWNGGKKTQINGFVDSQGRVWIHKDRGNAGTMIHEAVHKYSDHGLIGISQPLNEGVTEYFTRKVCAAVTPPITGRLNYQNNYDCVVVLVSLVTESTIASAYFDGKTDELKNAFIKAKSETDWDDFIGETKQNRWANATRLCTP